MGGGGVNCVFTTFYTFPNGYLLLLTKGKSARKYF